jgi:hypothetical protein
MATVAVTLLPATVAFAAAGAGGGAGTQTQAHAHLAHYSLSGAVKAVDAGDRVTSVGALDRSDPAAPVFTALRVTLRPAVDTGTDCAD